MSPSVAAPRPRRFDRRALTLLTLLLPTLALSLAGWPSGVATAAADPVEITEAPALTWGFKQSWRIYAPQPAVADGAVAVPPMGGALYQLTWAFESGSFDAATGTTVLRYGGSAHWLKYPASESSIAPPAGYDGPLDIHVLDVTLSDPIVTISGDAATVSVEARSRQLDTWEMADLGRVDVVGLDVADVTPTVADGVTTWANIPAATAGSSNEVFAGNYPTGRAVDAVGFSYTGPGGAPDFSEDFDAPGSAQLALAENRIITTDGSASQYSPWWIDRERRIVHYRSQTTAGDAVEWTYRAFSLDTLQELGDPLVLTDDERIDSPTLFDSTGGRLFYRRPGEEDTQRWIGYDAEQGRYVLGTLDASIPVAGQPSLMWDAVGQRAFNIDLTIPDGVSEDDVDSWQWQLSTYTEQQDGSWVRKAYDMPSFPPGLNLFGYAFNTFLNTPVGVGADDGSLILLGDIQFSLDPEVPDPATVPGAYRIAFDEGGESVSVNAIEGTDVPNDASQLFSTLQRGPDGQITLMRPANGSAPIVQTLTIPADGPGPQVAAPVSVPGLDTADATDFAVDPQDGTIWLGGWQSQRIVGVRDGAVIAGQFFPERHPRGGPVIAGADHSVYAQTNDGSPPVFGGSPIYGFGRFDVLGPSPTVTLQPQPAAVELGVAEQAEVVSFKSTATGGPAPSRQWQVKLPGSSRFTDLDGETGETLEVEAIRGLGGAQYRALYENAAGRIASEPATLEVAYAPRIAVDATSASATAGDDAVFQVMPEADPDPVVTWQRRVAGFWQTIGADDDDFTLAGGTLTVKDTNVEQSGALFRAKVSNAVASLYSKTAKLTVTAGNGIPDEGMSLSDVTLDWTGSSELQNAPPFGGSNYFSAGASDGSQATYATTSGHVSVLQASPGGGVSTPSWATRADHVASGGTQFARLSGGNAEIAADGSAEVRWSGSFSVNFYGGLVPFTLADPELVVDEDGTGTLSADLSGYGSSQANLGSRTPIDPVAGVTIATFSGVEIDPAGKVAIAPDYAGVEVSLPAGSPAQNRTAEGWGAWPQPFVDFHVATGLAPYWYSSGGAADAFKQPDPFVVDFSGSKQGGPVPSPGAGKPVPPATAADSTTTLTLGRSRYAYGSRTTASVRVTTRGGPAAGSVKLRVAGKTIVRSLATGSAKVTLPKALAPGRHRLSADYLGNAHTRPSSAGATLTVTKAHPRLSLRVLDPSLATSQRGRLRLVATIPGASRLAPTGQLAIRDGRQVLRVHALRRARHGRATIVLPRLTPGVHYLRASLSGGHLQHASTSTYRPVRVISRYSRADQDAEVDRDDQRRQLLQQRSRQ